MPRRAIRNPSQIYAQTSLYLVISGRKHILGPVNDVLDTVLCSTSTIVDEKDGKLKRLNG